MEAIKKLFQFPKPVLQVYSKAWLAVFAVLIVIDIVTKVWMTDHLTFHLQENQLRYATAGKVQALVEGIPQINLLGQDGNILKLNLVFNDRFVFGTGPSAPVVGVFINLFAVIFLTFYRLHNSEFGPSLAWLFVFSGAVGNLIDKMFVKSLETRDWVFSFGPRVDHVSGVVDFVEFVWFGWTPGWEMGAFTLPVLGTMRPLAWLAWPSWPLFNFADSLIVVGTILLVASMWLQRPAEEA